MSQDSGVQRRILDAAVRLFAEQGFAGTSVQQVVTEAEVTKGALYHYFDSKDDLLYEIYHSLIARQLADLDRIAAAGGPRRDAVRAVIVSLIGSTADHVNEARVFARESHRLDHDRMHALRADRRRYRVTFRALIEDGQKDGAFATHVSADTATMVALGMINQLPQWYRPGGPKSAEELAEEVADFVLAALEPR